MKRLPKFFAWGGGSVRTTWSFGWLTGSDADLVCVRPCVAEENACAADWVLSPVCGTRATAFLAFVLKYLLVILDQNISGVRLEGCTMTRVPAQDFTVGKGVITTRFDTSPMVCFPGTYTLSPTIRLHQCLVAPCLPVVMGDPGALTLATCTCPSCVNNRLWKCHLVISLTSIRSPGIYLVGDDHQWCIGHVNFCPVQNLVFARGNLLKHIGVLGNDTVQSNRHMLPFAPNSAESMHKVTGMVYSESPVIHQAQLDELSKGGQSVKLLCHLHLIGEWVGRTIRMNDWAVKVAPLQRERVSINPPGNPRNIFVELSPNSLGNGEVGLISLDKPYSDFFERIKIRCHNQLIPRYRLNKYPLSFIDFSVPQFCGNLNLETAKGEPCPWSSNPGVNQRVSRLVQSRPSLWLSVFYRPGLISINGWRSRPVRRPSSPMLCTQWPTPVPGEQSATSRRG